MFMIVNGLRIRPVKIIQSSGGLVTVAFTDVARTACTRVRASRLYETEEEARAALEAAKAKKAAWGLLNPGEAGTQASGGEPVRSREMERRWLIDHSGKPDP